MVELNKEYNEITQEMSDYINDHNLEIINIGDKFKVVPYVPSKEQQIIELKSKLANMDYKHLRQQRERALLDAGVIAQLTMPENLYLEFCREQSEMIKQINLLEVKCELY